MLRWSWCVTSNFWLFPHPGTLRESFVEHPVDRADDDAQNGHTHDVHDGRTQAEFSNVEETVGIAVDDGTADKRVDSPDDRDDKRGKSEDEPDIADVARAPR